MRIGDLAEDGRLIVKQRVEMFEALTGIETRNRYDVLTPDGGAVMLAYEESGALSRLFLKRHRPLTLHIADLDGRDILVASRGFFWYFSHLMVRDGEGRPIGAIRRKFGLLRRKMVIEDARGAVVAEVSGAVFRTYTFTIKRQEREIGKVTKQWGGLGRELFTDADTFLVELPIEYGDELQSLVLATAFAVDLDFFEQR